MPKNMFQRPQPVTRNSNVPRHGAPIPSARPTRRSQPTSPTPRSEAILKGLKRS